MLIFHGDTGFLLLLWIGSTYLSIGIPVRKQLKSHNATVKHRMKRHSVLHLEKARAKISKISSPNEENSKIQGSGTIEAMGS